MRRGVVLAISVVLVVSALFSTLLFQLTQSGNVMATTVTVTTTVSESFQANDFVGQWYLADPNGPPTSSFTISEDNGSYALDTSFGTQDSLGTTILTVNPPNAHAIYNLQNPSGILDLRLQLLSLTWMQVTILGQIQVSDGATTSITQTFLFTKTKPTIIVPPTSGGQQVKQQVIMEAYSWVTLTSLTITLRNVGPAQVQFADFFINGNRIAAVTGSCTGPGVTLGVGSSCTVTLTLPSGSYSSGVAYVVKVVSVDGAVFSYSAIAGSAS